MNIDELRKDLKNFWDYGIRRKRLTILDLVNENDLPVTVGGVGPIGDLVAKRIGWWHPAVRSPKLQLDLVSEEKHPELQGRIGLIGSGYAVLPPEG